MYKYRKKRPTRERVGHYGLTPKAAAEEQDIIPDNLNDAVPSVKPKDKWQQKFDAISQALSYTRK